MLVFKRNRNLYMSSPYITVLRSTYWNTLEHKTVASIPSQNFPNLIEVFHILRFEDSHVPLVHTGHLGYRFAYCQLLNMELQGVHDPPNSSKLDLSLSKRKYYRKLCSCTVTTTQTQCRHLIHTADILLARKENQT